MVQTMEGSIVRRTNLFLFRMKMFGVQTMGKVNSLNYFKVSST